MWSLRTGVQLLCRQSSTLVSARAQSVNKSAVSLSNIAQQRLCYSDSVSTKSVASVDSNSTESENTSGKKDVVSRKTKVATAGKQTVPEQAMFHLESALTATSFAAFLGSFGKFQNLLKTHQEVQPLQSSNEYIKLLERITVEFESMTLQTSLASYERLSRTKAEPWPFLEMIERLVVQKATNTVELCSTLSLYKGLPSTPRKERVIKHFYELLPTITSTTDDIKTLCHCLTLVPGEETAASDAIEKVLQEKIKVSDAVGAYSLLIRLVENPGRNNRKLVIAIFSKLRWNLEQLPVNILMNLLIHFSKFRVSDKDLFLKICGRLRMVMVGGEQFSQSQLVDMLCSLDETCIKDNATIGTILEQMNLNLGAEEDSTAGLSPFVLMKLCTAISKLNCEQNMVGNLLTSLKEKVDWLDLFKNKPGHLLRCVWCLAQIELADRWLVEKMLSEFQKKSSKTTGLVDTNVQSRLLNLHGYLVLDLGVTDIAAVQCNKTHSPGLVLQQSKFATTICKFMEEQNYIFQRNVHTEYGHRIDAEMYVDTEGNTVDVSNGKKVAVLCLGRNSVLKLSGLTEPTGYYSMAKRHLEKSGYSVVLLDILKWGKAPDDDKHNFLKKIILESISEEKPTG